MPLPTDVDAGLVNVARSTDAHGSSSASRPVSIRSSADESSTNDDDLSMWHRFSFAAVRGFLWIMLRVFSLTGLYRFGQAFGALEWAINIKRRRKFHQRMQDLFGDTMSAALRARHCRGFFMRTRCDKIFYLIFDFLSREQALACFEPEGFEIIERSREQGRSCLVITSHYGAQHVGAMWMPLKGFKMAGVRDRKEGAMRRYIQSMYDRRYPEFGRMLILFADSYPRDIYRCFEDGYVVGAALDVQPSRGDAKRSVDVQFFGQTRSFLTGTLRIAMRAGAEVCQGLVVCKPGFRYTPVIFDLLPKGAYSADSPGQMQQIMQRYAENLETYLRKHPDHISRI